MLRSATAALLAAALLSACGGDPEPAWVDPSLAAWPDHLSPLPPRYTLGGDAPDFHLPVLSSGGVGPDSIRLSDHRGRVVVLNFWTTDCGPCVAEHETLNRVAERMARKGVVYLGINSRDSPATLARFEAVHGPASYPNLRDARREAGLRFRQAGWPLHVVIDRDGRVVWWARGGPVPEDRMVRVLRDVLRGRRPRPAPGTAWADELR